MAKGTVIFLSLLAVIAVLLLGINIGKKINSTSTITPQQAAETQQLPTEVLQPTTENPPPGTAIGNQSGTSTYTDNSCGFSFSYPGSYLKQETANKNSVIYLDPKNPKIIIAATCAASLPKPPVSADKQETVTLAGAAGTLYHDTDPTGNPRDDIFVKHPTNGMEIVIAGYGETFQTIRTTFKFIQ